MADPTRSRTVILEINTLEYFHQSFRGDGNTGVFTLDAAYRPGSLQVYQDGLRLDPYTEADDTDAWLNKYFEADSSTGKIQFLHAPPNGAVISIWYRRKQVTS